jgi:hypothetical protein
MIAFLNSSIRGDIANNISWYFAVTSALGADGHTHAANPWSTRSLQLFEVSLAASSIEPDLSRLARDEIASGEGMDRAGIDAFMTIAAFRGDRAALWSQGRVG